MAQTEQHIPHQSKEGTLYEVPFFRLCIGWLIAVERRSCSPIAVYLTSGFSAVETRWTHAVAAVQLLAAPSTFEKDQHDEADLALLVRV